jgi:hypothetical protein
MTFSRANALGWNPLDLFTAAQANTIDINQSRAVDGFAGGTYNPTAGLTWNNQLTVDATAGIGANITGMTVTGKGTGWGIVSLGGATSGSGIQSTGGNPNGAGLEAIGVGLGIGVDAQGGATAGTGVRGIGGTDGIGIYAQGGGPNGDALWAVAPGGPVPGATNNDYGIWASSAGAFPATAVSGRSDLGYGLIGITASGMGCALTATSTGSPLRLVPRTGNPSTNVAAGCIYYDDTGNGSLKFYDDTGAWRTISFT